MVHACLYIMVQEFRSICHKQAYFDVHIFNPLAAAKRQTYLFACFRSHDHESIRHMNNVSIKLSMDRLLRDLHMIIRRSLKHYIQVHYLLL